MPLSFEIDVPINKDAGSAIRNAQRQRIEDAMSRGFSESLEHVPEDRGTLRHSGYEPTWRADGSSDWGYRANHALPMERGTRPFHPPTQPLVEWAKRVAGDPGLGYYVANVKIPEEGITAQPFAEPGAEAAKKWLEARGFSQYFEDEL